MTTILKEQIKKYFPEYQDSDIQFLKFSTAGSGVGKYNKIIFLAFSDGGTIPFCCIKTVRTYAENSLILNGFKNLQYLNKLTADSFFEEMFPSVMGLYDDKKEIVFSIESACDGNKISSNNINIDFILNKYFEFQKYISKSNKKHELLSDYFDGLLKKFHLSDLDIAEINSYFLKLREKSRNKICLVPQHGDLTLDNVLISNKDICVIDCDLFGHVELAGLDLFHFLLRYKRDDFMENLEKYFLRYSQSINEDFYFDKDLAFLYYLNDLLIKGDGIAEHGAKNIIVNFNKLFSKNA